MLALAGFPASPPQVTMPIGETRLDIRLSLGCPAGITGVAALLYPPLLNNLSSIIRLTPYLQPSPVSSSHIQDHPCWIRPTVSLARRPLGQWPRPALREKSRQWQTAGQTVGQSFPAPGNLEFRGFTM